MMKAMAREVKYDKTEDEEDDDATGYLHPARRFLLVFQRHSDKNS
jgi:hypothetical protein